MDGLAGDEEDGLRKLWYTFSAVAMSALYGKHNYHRIVKKEADCYWHRK